MKRVKQIFKYSILGVFILGVVFVSQFKANAAGCQLTGTSFSKQTVVVGESVGITVVGQGCGGQTVIANIYGKYGLGKFLIKSIPLAFTPNPTATTTNISFTANDISGRNSDVEASIEAVLDNKTSTINSINSLVIKVPVGGGCQLSTARLEGQFKSSPILGSPLHMIVNGSGCAGYGVSFKIYTADTFTEEVETVNGVFDSGGILIDKVWVASNKNDTRPLSSRLGNYNFYFIASAGTSKATSNQVKIPANSEQGCINCNNLTAPSTCMCADGFSGDRSLANSCDSVCSSHVGDSKTLTSPTNPTNPTGPGSGTGTGSGGTSKTYSFSIDNPIKGGPNDLFDIINIITKWLLNISIPIAVLGILWAGFLMLTAGATPAKFEQGKKILINIVIGLAVIFIGRGFITLIFSIIELGGTDSTTQTENSLIPPTAPAGTNCINNTCENTGLRCTSFADCQPVAGLGNICSSNKDCASGQTCNQICQRSGGNGIGEACKKTSDPSNCKSNACSTIGNSEDGKCVEYSTNSSGPTQQYQNILTLKALEVNLGSPVNQPHRIELVVENPVSMSQVYNWAVVGGSIPPGMTLLSPTIATEGLISGTATRAGNYNVTIQAMDTTNKQYGRVEVQIHIR